MRRLISFATAEYRAAAQTLADSARPYFDEIQIYTPTDISAKFYADHKRHFEYRRGFGYWIWKPYFILINLMDMKPDDVLFYADSQHRFVADPAPVFECARRNDGICLFHQKREGHINEMWVRRDTFELMGCDSERYRNGDNLNASHFCWTPTEESRAFVQKWLTWCMNFNVIADGKSRLPEYPRFRDNRQDQSILSLLAIKEELKTFRDASQWGNGYNCPNSPYGQITHHDRKIIAPWARRPRMSSIIEVSTLATCPLRCAYCPQDKLGQAYEGPKKLDIATFRRCLDNLVPGDAVYFAGFTEPCLAKDFMEMLYLTIERKHRCRLYTTGRGLTVTQAAEIAAMIGVEKIVIHLPDSFGHLPRNKASIPVVEELAKHNDAEVMAMDNSPHPDFRDLWGRVKQNLGAMHDRAGNVTTIQIAHQKHTGAIKCGVAPQLDHPVLLPNGDLVLCCMDYSLKYVISQQIAE